MTLNNAILRFNTEYKNNIPDALKRTWLSDLDHDIHTNIILTHENNAPAFTGYDESTPDGTLLLIPDPFSRIYLNYLAMKTDHYHGDITRYNNDLVLYSSAYMEYENYYNRNHAPLKLTSHFNI